MTDFRRRPGAVDTRFVRCPGVLGRPIRDRFAHDICSPAEHESARRSPVNLEVVSKLSAGQIRVVPLRGCRASSRVLKRLLRTALLVAPSISRLRGFADHVAYLEDIVAKARLATERPQSTQQVQVPGELGGGLVDGQAGLQDDVPQHFGLVVLGDLRDGPSEMRSLPALGVASLAAASLSRASMTFFARARLVANRNRPR